MTNDWLSDGWTERGCSDVDRIRVAPVNAKKMHGQLDIASGGPGGLLDPQFRDIIYQEWIRIAVYNRHCYAVRPILHNFLNIVNSEVPYKGILQEAGVTPLPDSLDKV